MSNSVDSSVRMARADGPSRGGLNGRPASAADGATPQNRSNRGRGSNVTRARRGTRSHWAAQSRRRNVEEIKIGREEKTLDEASGEFIRNPKREARVWTSGLDRRPGASVGSDTNDACPGKSSNLIPSSRRPLFSQNVLHCTEFLKGKKCLNTCRDLHYSCPHLLSKRTCQCMCPLFKCKDPNAPYDCNFDCNPSHDVLHSRLAKQHDLSVGRIHSFAASQKAQQIVIQPQVPAPVLSLRERIAAVVEPKWNDLELSLIALIRRKNLDDVFLSETLPILRLREFSDDQSDNKFYSFDDSINILTPTTYQLQFDVTDLLHRCGNRGVCSDGGMFATWIISKNNPIDVRRFQPNFVRGVTEFQVGTMDLVRYAPNDNPSLLAEPLIRTFTEMIPYYRFWKKERDNRIFGEYERKFMQYARANVTHNLMTTLYHFVPNELNNNNFYSSWQNISEQQSDLFHEVTNSTIDWILFKSKPSIVAGLKKNVMEFGEVCKELADYKKLKRPNLVIKERRFGALCKRMIYVCFLILALSLVGMVVSSSADFLFGGESYFLSSGAYSARPSWALSFFVLAVSWYFIVDSEESSNDWARFRDFFNMGLMDMTTVTYGFAQGFNYKDMLFSQIAHPTYHEDSQMEEKHEVHFFQDGVEVDGFDNAPTKPALSVVVGTNASLFPPTPGISTLHYALLARNLKQTPDCPDDKIWTLVFDQIKESLLKTSAEFLDDGKGVRKLEPFSHQEWIDHYSTLKKRELAAKAVAEYFANNDPSTIFDLVTGKFAPGFKMKLKKLVLRMHAKSDETLAPKLHNGVYGLKPRTIISLPMWLQVIIQPWCRAGAARFKEILKDSVFSITINGITKRYWFQYTSGWTGKELTEWLPIAQARASEGIICAVVQGDDSLVIQLTEDGRLEYVESDYSHFDNSQKEVQINFENRWWKELVGIPEGIVEILDYISIAKVRAVSHDKKIIYQPGFPIRITGAPTTSSGNSINNIGGLIIASFKNFSEEGFLEAGFKAVTNRAYAITDVTFLRGTWQPFKNDDSYRWILLPSLIGKLGKVGREILDETDLWNSAKSIYGNIKHIPLDYPCLGDLRRALERILTNEQKKTAKPDWMRYYDGKNDLEDQDYLEGELDVSFVRQWTLERYGITEDDLLSIKMLFSKITTLPAWIGHPALQTIVSRDYY